jgi:chromosomal replication initiation ATPase DnaA
VALRQRLGDEVFKAWLGKVAVVSIEGNQLVLSAPTKFIAMRIDRDHGAAILECWRVQHPQIQRLEVIVAGATAPAATPISNRRAPSQVVDARWLLEEGRTIVRERLFVADDVAQGRLVEWLKRCGNDAAGLRQVITAADQQDLVGDRFRAIVQRQVEALLHGGQGALKFGPEAVVKRRSAS